MVMTPLSFGIRLAPVVLLYSICIRQGRCLLQAPLVCLYRRPNTREKVRVIKKPQAALALSTRKNSVDPLLFSPLSLSLLQDTTL